MQTSLETLGELERRLTMSVPVAEIESEIQQRLARLAKNVKVPGFRPGKVPLKMVAQQYGPQVRSDVISDAVKTNFADAIREQNLRIAGNPRIEPKPEAAAPDQLEFSAIFEIYPGSEGRRPLGGHDRAAAGGSRPGGHRAHDRDAAPPAHALRAVVARRRRRRSRRSSTSRARPDGVEFPGGPGDATFAIVLGEGRMLPEFETARRRDERRRDHARSRSRFPADYHGKEVAGKEAEFALTVKRVEAGHRARRSMPSSRARSASRAAASTSSRPRSRRT